MASSNGGWLLRLPSLLVLLVLSAGSITAAEVVASDARSEQRSLLIEKTAVAGLLVGNVFSEFGQNISQLASTLDSTQGFDSEAESLIGEMSWIGVVSHTGDETRLVDSIGRAPLSSGSLPSGFLQLAARAESAKEYVSSVLEYGSGRHLVYARSASPTEIVYGVVGFDLSDSYIGSGDGNPFSDLTGALYAGPNTDSQQLILTDTRHLPLAGEIVDQTVSVGSDQWTLAATASGPLISALVRNAVWGVLIGGLLAALLATIVVEVLARRRSYALSLVHERTSALREALSRQAELESQERAARQTAESANRSKSEFLSRMSHELRTPLNAILGFGQLLQLDSLTDPQEEAVNQITKGGRHLLALINDVLDISRIETGNLAMSQEPVAVGDLVHETVTMLTPNAASRQIQLDIDGQDTAGLYVLADHQRLKQVLVNFLSNAIKYNRVGGRVTVGAETTKDRIRIYVEDDGPGIPTENLDRLFLPFERLGAERTQVEGTGVGLALSRRLAEVMGGSVGVRSTFGEGSRFWIDLPATAGPLELLDDLDQYSVEPGEGTGMQRHEILYIEDNLSNIRLIDRLLQRRGNVELIPAMQGRLGLTLAAERRPALILLDLHLPDMHGLDILREIRRNPTIASTPVVILSADANPSEIKRMMAEGASAYLTKPLDIRLLHDEISRALDLSSPIP